MSTVTTDAKAVVQGYLDALLAGDLEGIRACFAPDATWTIYGDLPIAGPWHGRDAIVDDFLGTVGWDLFEAGSGPEFEFPTLIGEGNTVALEWRVTARSAAGAEAIMGSTWARAATSPITSRAGPSRPAAALGNSARRVKTLRSSERLAFSTTSTGVEGARPAATRRSASIGAVVFQTYNEAV